MSDLGILVPIGIVGIIAARGAFNTWVRAKHGYPIADESRRAQRARRVGADGLDDDRRIGLLTNENERLHGQVSRLEDRIAVLERIATDPAERTSREIEALRAHN